MKSLALGLALLMMTPLTAGVSRSRSRYISSYHDNVNRVVIEQKVLEYDDSLKIIAVPVTDIGLQYYYQSEPLRGRGLSEDDKKQIIEEVVAGVLKGIDEKFEVVPDEGGENGNQGGGVVPPVQPPTDNNTSALDAAILKIVTSKCSTCHTEDGLAKDGIPTLLKKDGSLSVLADLKDEKLRRWDIHDSVFSGRMPKNDTPLTDEEVDTFKQWAKAVKVK